MNTNRTSTPGSENEEPAANEKVKGENAQAKKPEKAQTRGANSNTSQPGEKAMFDPNTDLQAVKNPG